MPEARVLVVEDDPSIRQILMMQLTKAGFDVEGAADGATGLARAEAAPPDLVLLDVMMPEMDGFEVCRRLRASRHTQHVPVIMLTARTAGADKVSGLECGANDYLEKPYQGPELLARVRGVLAWSRAQRNASPLTGLPGNTSIEAAVVQRLVSETPFAFLYADIDHFKAYNDRYGYARGDEAIRSAADALVATVEALGSPGDFVGHIGGDDFVAIVAVDRAAVIAERFRRSFDAAVPALYADEDRARGYVEVRGRRGDVERTPLMTITIAVVMVDTRRFAHYGALIDVAAELKRYGKGRRGSVVVQDRRAEDAEAAEITVSPSGSGEEERHG